MEHHVNVALGDI